MENIAQMSLMFFREKRDVKIELTIVYTSQQNGLLYWKNRKFLA